MVLGVIGPGGSPNWRVPSTSKLMTSWAVPRISEKDTLKYSYALLLQEGATSFPAGDIHPALL